MLLVMLASVSLQLRQKCMIERRKAVLVQLREWDGCLRAVQQRGDLAEVERLRLVLEHSVESRHGWVRQPAEVAGNVRGTRVRSRRRRCY